jgi:hypothetical protein
MGLSKDDTVTPASPPHTSALRRLQIRWRWRVRTLMGWKVEGAFPNLHEPRLILLGPGLSRTSGWTDFIEMRFRHRCHWWSPDMDAPEISHVLAATEEHDLEEVLKWASTVSLQVHLVHRDDRHRRLRCNTAIETGRHLHRLQDYIRRIFSYAPCEA